MKVWITKYALTSGILIRKDGETNDEFPNMVTFEERRVQPVHGEDWHTTEQAALARAEHMRVTKIESLKKQISKLEAMRFRVPKS